MALGDAERRAEAGAGAGRLDRSLAYLAAIIPVVLVASIRAYHQDDVGLFDSWALLWGPGRTVYDPTIPYAPNYPILGEAVSAGAMRLFGQLTSTLPARHLAFRLWLSLFDAAALLLTWRLLARAGVRNAGAWVVLLAVLPSTWAGGAVWGQIDGVGELLVIAALISLWHASSFLDGALPRWRWWFAGALTMSALVLCKQLLVFAIVPLAVAWVVVTVRAASVAPRRALLVAASAALLFVVTSLLPDAFLAVPAPFRSHLAYVWLGGGSNHGALLGANGFNVWMLLDRDMFSSSAAPVSGWLVPRTAGEGLFLAYATFVAAFLYRHRPASLSRGWTFGHLVFAMALVQLAFNVLLTGTHERYLFHFYPLALVALLFWRARAPSAVSTWSIVALAAAGTLYGLFVLDLIAPLPEWLFLGTDVGFLCGVHVALLAWLTHRWTTILMANAHERPAGQPL